MPLGLFNWVMAAIDKQPLGFRHPFYVLWAEGTATVFQLWFRKPACSTGTRGL
jgi:hypothetical protein